jgi:hypothetical protein
MSRHTLSRPPPPARNAMSVHTRWRPARHLGPLPVKRQLRGGIRDEHFHNVDPPAPFKGNLPARGEVEDLAVLVAQADAVAGLRQVRDAEERLFHRRHLEWDRAFVPLGRAEGDLHLAEVCDPRPVGGPVSPTGARPDARAHSAGKQAGGGSLSGLPPNRRQPRRRGRQAPRLTPRQGAPRHRRRRRGGSARCSGCGRPTAPTGRERNVPTHSVEAAPTGESACSAGAPPTLRRRWR